MGHIVTECGDGIHGEDQCQWDNWLKVMFEANVTYGDGRGTTGCSGVLGRGRGRGRVPGEPNVSKATDMDWGSVGGGATGQGARKRPRGGNNLIGASPGSVAQQVNLLEYGKGDNNLEKSQSSPQKEHALKRQKKVVNGVVVEELIGSATSGWRIKGSNETL
jgi:hypothetical protein